MASGCRLVVSIDELGRQPAGGFVPQLVVQLAREVHSYNEVEYLDAVHVEARAEHGWR